MRNGLTMQELEAATCACGEPGCENETLYFHGKCHPQVPSVATYKKGTGKLTLRCSTCGQMVVEIAVASVS